MNLFAGRHIKNAANRGAGEKHSISLAGVKKPNAAERANALWMPDPKLLTVHELDDEMPKRLSPREGANRQAELFLGHALAS